MVSANSVAWLVFFGTYLALALGYVPWLRLDRTGAAFVGAVAMLATGTLTLEQGFLAQDYQTLVLLFSMMLVVSFLVNSGILTRLQEAALGRLATRRGLFWGTLLASGLLSALFINDVVCLALTPLVIHAASARSLNPVPFLLATAMGSNIGSLATPVGNPQNVYIASISGLGYSTFVLSLAPVALIGLLICGAWLEWLYRRGWDLPLAGGPTEPEGEPLELKPYVLYRTAAVVCGILVGFWAGYPLPIVAAGGAAILLLTRRVPRQKIFGLVDWDLLVLFCSLFVLIAGARQAGIIDDVYGWLSAFRPSEPLSFSVLTLLLSNLFSNVPAVLFLGQIVPSLGSPEPLYLLLAMVSTLAGNLTLIGSIANLIVAEKAKPAVDLDFWTYTRAGVPVTLSTLAVGLGYWWIMVR